MNQISVLMHLLTKRESLTKIGASEDEIVETLNLSKKTQSILFNDIMTKLAHYLEPLGLNLSFNPLDSHWFITHNSEISEFINANPFENKPKLAATLFCVLVSCLKNNGIGRIEEIKEMRKKQNLMEDLSELSDKGYLKIIKEQSQVELTSLVGYQLDVNKLFMNLSLKLKNGKSMEE